MTESEWQQQVIDLAHLLGWSHLHVRRSIGKGKRWVTATNRVGWCDLFLWHRTHGFLALELKVGRNVPAPEQLDVLHELSEAGAQTMVAWPDDIEDVAYLLTGRKPARSAA